MLSAAALSQARQLMNTTTYSLKHDRFTQLSLRFRNKLLLLGPAFIAAIGYIDPGNFATNIEAGSTFGYQLLWVVLWANFMAMLIQYLSAKLGIVTGKNLAEHLRERLPKWAIVPYWIQAELIAIATDLAEFIGAAVGFQLLFGIRLIDCAAITAATTVAATCNHNYYIDYTCFTLINIVIIYFMVN